MRLRARGGRWRVSGAASREGLSRGLPECGGRGWGGAGRRGGARAGQVGEDGLHGEGILHGLLIRAKCAPHFRRILPLSSLRDLRRLSG